MEQGLELTRKTSMQLTYMGNSYTRQTSSDAKPVVHSPTAARLTTPVGPRLLQPLKHSPIAVWSISAEGR